MILVFLLGTLLGFAFGAALCTLAWYSYLRRWPTRNEAFVAAATQRRAWAARTTTGATSATFTKADIDVMQEAIRAIHPTRRHPT